MTARGPNGACPTDRRPRPARPDRRAYSAKVGTGFASQSSLRRLRRLICGRIRSNYLLERLRTVIVGCENALGAGCAGACRAARNAILRRWAARRACRRFLMTLSSGFALAAFAGCVVSMVTGGPPSVAIFV